MHYMYRCKVVDRSYMYLEKSLPCPLPISYVISFFLYIIWKGGGVFLKLYRLFIISFKTNLTEDLLVTCISLFFSTNFLHAISLKLFDWLLPFLQMMGHNINFKQFWYFACLHFQYRFIDQFIIFTTYIVQSSPPKNSLRYDL